VAVTLGAAGAAPDVDPQPLPEPPGTGPFASPPFRLLFAGQAISVFGDRVVMVAIPFAVLGVHGAGPADVGIVLAAGALALAVMVLVGGVWADRLPRRATMLASDLIRCIVQAVAGTLLLTGHGSVAMLVAVQLAYGGADAFFRPASLALLPELLPEGQLQPANALMGLSSNISMVVGPAVAGVLVATVGAGGALVFDAATFAVSALSLAALRVPRPVARGSRSSFRSELRAGFAEVRQRSWVWSTILTFGVYHAFVLPALFVLGPLYAELHRDGASSWGLISAGFGVGAVAGSVVALRWRPRVPGVVIAGSLLVASSQAAIVILRLPTLGVAALECVTGVMVALAFTVWETALQRHIPMAAQARVSSFDYLGSLTLMPVGYVVIGALVASVGIRPLGIAASIAGWAAAAALLAAPGVRQLR
jgi:MFS family permease